MSLAIGSRIPSNTRLPSSCLRTSPNVARLPPRLNRSRHKALWAFPSSTMTALSNRITSWSMPTMMTIGTIRTFSVRAVSIHVFLHLFACQAELQSLVAPDRIECEFQCRLSLEHTPRLELPLPCYQGHYDRTHISDILDFVSYQTSCETSLIRALSKSSNDASVMKASTLGIMSWPWRLSR